jgi:molybdate/tungstate transport system substrate-binding protein
MALVGLVAIGCCAAGTVAAAETLLIYAAGTLAVPLGEIDTLFERANPGVTVTLQTGGSVMMAKRIADLHQRPDILAVADYNVIPKYLFGVNGEPVFTDWYVGFARNALTFLYTPKSKGAQEISPQNWYDVLSRPGVKIGRGNPDTDPSGYRLLQMLSLAETYYERRKLAKRVLKNAGPDNVRDTETELIPPLQRGEIDYLADYRSDAVQHHLQSLDLPPGIDLSDPACAPGYAAAVAHTGNGDVPGTPIVYAATILAGSPHAELAAKYLAFVLSPEGQAVFTRDGFGAMNPPIAVNLEGVPPSLRALVNPWPSS